MTSTPTTNFDHTAAKVYVKHIGMVWDQAFAERTDLIAFESGITQEQWDVMVREYAWRMKQAFTPSTYGWWVRILLALHFLNPFARKLS